MPSHPRHDLPGPRPSSHALALALVLWAAALVGRPVQADIWAAFATFTAYLAVAATLVTVLLVAARLGRAARMAAAIVTATVVVWHLREITFRPPAPAAFAGAAVALAIPLTLLGERLAARPPASLRRTIAIGLVGAAITTTAYVQSPRIRWHILRHHTLIGTPVFLLTEPPVRSHAPAQLPPRQPPAEPETTPPNTTTAAPPAVPTTGPVPAIAVVLVDTLRADALAAYGGDPAQMPELNRWVANSEVFADVHSTSGWTRTAIASLFTGLAPEAHGALDRHDALDPAHATLAETLSARGFRTAAYVTNFSAAGRQAGFAQGFAEFLELRDGAAAYVRAHYVADDVGDWLDRNTPLTTPTFLYVHLLDPHTPYLSGGGGAATPAAMRDGYDHELAYLDTVLPGLLETLQARLGPRAAILLTSDHGEEFGEHGGVEHCHSLYRELVDVPLVMRRAAAPTPATFDAPLTLADAHDLVLDLAATPDLDAAGWAERHARAWRYAALYQNWDMAIHRPYLARVAMRSLIVPPWQLIWSGYGDTWELYHRGRDPGQLANVYGLADAPVTALTEQLLATPATRHPRVPMAPDDATLDQLRALGYAQ